MAKKYITVRFYRHADSDLMALYYRDVSQMPKLMKEALRTFVDGKGAKVEVPAFDSNISLLRSKVSVHVILDVKDDADLIDAVKMVPAGYRCAFLKNIMRYQMAEGYTDIYFSDNLTSNRA